MKSYALWTLPSITALALILLANPLHAQSVGQARVVGTCGTASYTAGENGPVTIDTTGDGCIAGSITASLAGFTPNGSVATLAVTNSSGNVALPSGTVVAVANTGSVDASIKLSVGAGTAATTDFILKAGATAGLTVGSNTFINAITAASTTTLSLAGGSGLVSGYGGGGGGTITGVAQGSTTSGQTVVPVGCRTLTSAPTDTTAQTNMPSCDTAGALRVNVTSATGVAQGSTTSGQTISPIGCRTLTSAPTDTTAQTNMPWCTTKGSLVAAQPTAADLNATVVGTGTFAVQNTEVGATSGGLSVSTFEPAASDNHTNLKNGAGQVYWITAFNNSATVNYLRLYNAATGFNGCNSATNLVATFHIPSNSTSDAGFVTQIPTGLPFSTGISYCVVSAYGQTTTTNATASAMDITIGYK